MEKKNYVHRLCSAVLQPEVEALEKDGKALGCARPCLASVTLHENPTLPIWIP